MTKSGKIEKQQEARLKLHMSRYEEPSYVNCSSFSPFTMLMAATLHEFYVAHR